MKFKMYAPLIASAVLIAFAALTRFIPHPWNSTAIGALSIFAGVYLVSRWSAVAVTFAALFVTDLVLGFHSTMPYVYGAFAIITLVSFSQLKEKKWSLIGTGSIAATLFFFLVSNFGVWAEGGFYSSNWQGLVECYVAGIPFLGNQIIGDLLYVVILFGAREVLERTVILRLAPVAQKQ